MAVSPYQIFNFWVGFNMRKFYNCCQFVSAFSICVCAILVLSMIWWPGPGYVPDMDPSERARMNELFSLTIRVAGSSFIIFLLGMFVAQIGGRFRVLQELYKQQKD